MMSVLKTPMFFQEKGGQLCSGGKVREDRTTIDSIFLWQRQHLPTKKIKNACWWHRWQSSEDFQRSRGSLFRVWQKSDDWNRFKRSGWWVTWSCAIDISVVMTWIIDLSRVTFFHDLTWVKHSKWLDLSQSPKWLNSPLTWHREMQHKRSVVYSLPVWVPTLNVALWEFKICCKNAR